MKKLVILCVFLAAVYFAIICQDMAYLQNNVIRLHVVGHSNDGADQAVKLELKDALIGYLYEQMPAQTDVDSAKVFLKDNIENLEAYANDFLRSKGYDHAAKVSMKKEAFQKRVYETFTLPSGVYESLRVCIGEGSGNNWWCVVFPTLCAGKNQQEYRDIAAGAGFSQNLIETTMQEEGYEIRFYLLDCIGKIEKFFHFR